MSTSTRLRFAAAVLLAACVLFVTGCGWLGLGSPSGGTGGGPGGGSPPGPGPHAPGGDPSPDPGSRPGSGLGPGLADGDATDEAAARAWADEMVAHMSLPEKVGQLFVMYGYGQSADTDDADARANNAALYGYPTFAEAVAALQPGGVIYFGWTDNIAAPEQIAALSAGLQEASLTSGAGVPLLIGIDHEGGLVSRLGPPFTAYPGNMALAAGGVAQAAEEAAAFMAAELRAVGINWNFAPVADVNVNPHNPVIGVRSFGSDPEAVAAFVAAQVAGFQQAGVAASAKHFPGHGDTDVDSHTGLPVIGHSVQDVHEFDLPPFASAITAGVDSIMVAHIAVPALDPSGLPATFSRPIVTGLLRDELGYDGVIVTDALDMAGAQLPVPAGQTAVAALQAGADMLLMPPDPVAAIATVIAAVESGELSEERIDESVRRILLLKWRRGLVAAARHGELTRPAGDVDVIGRDAHRVLANAIAERAITAAKNDGGVLPLRSGRIVVTGFGHEASAVAAGLQQAGLDAHGVNAGTAEEAVAQAAAVAAAEAALADVNVVLTDNALRSAAQRTVVDAVIATGKPVVIVALQEPYDLALYPDVAGHMATFSGDRLTVEALVRVLTGELAPQGRLPVSVPTRDASGDLYPVGYGLR